MFFIKNRKNSFKKEDKIIPSQTHDMWIRCAKKKKQMENHNGGKWVLKFHPDDIDSMWHLYKALYIRDQLSGIVSMKCKNYMNYSIIVFYCNIKNHEEFETMCVGRELKSHIIGTHIFPTMFYKTYEHTRNKKANSRYLYSLRV